MYECKGNRNQTCTPGDMTQDYSMASALVFWIGNIAKADSIELKGENALPVNPCERDKWNNISNVFTYSNYKGITILRLENVCNPDVHCTPNYFETLINNLK